MKSILLKDAMRRLGSTMKHTNLDEEIAPRSIGSRPSETMDEYSIIRRQQVLFVIVGKQIYDSKAWKIPSIGKRYGL